MCAQLFDIRSKQNQRGQSGRGDCISFGHCFHGVADGIKFVGDLADFLGQVAHHRYSARVVGNWTERIERDDDSSHR